MTLRDRVLLPLVEREVRGRAPSFDLGSLFLHLILFEGRAYGPGCAS